MVPSVVRGTFVSFTCFSEVRPIEGYVSVTSMFRKTTKNLFSIVDCLNCRSVTGLMPGLDIHRHSYYEIVLFWNTQPNTGCYKSCIVRYGVDCIVDNQI